MTFPSQIFSELHVPRSQRDLPATCNLYLPSAAERDHVLATWRSMPIIDPAGRRPMDLGARDPQRLGDLAETASGECDFDLIGVRLTVRSCVKPSHEPLRAT